MRAVDPKHGELLKAPTSGAPIVVIIHGTWASRAKWARLEAPLAQQLLKDNPQCGLIRFQWGGWNRLSSRQAGAKRLAQLFAELKASSADSPVLAVSHSHGGNVLWWATDITAIDRAVFVNTPFFNVLPVLRHELWHTASVAAIAMMLCFWMIGVLQDWPGWAVTLVIGATLSVGGGLYVGLDQRLRKLTECNPSINKRLVVTTVGDEALTILTSFNGLQGLAMLLLEVIAVLSVLALVLGGFVPESWELAITSRSPLSFEGFMSLVPAVLAAMIGSAMLANGPLHGVLAITRSLAVSAIPAAAGVIDARAVRRETTALRHSAMSDPVVVDIIAAWINDRQPVCDLPKDERSLEERIYDLPWPERPPTRSADVQSGRP